MSHQQNTFGILGQNKLDDDSVETVATQVAALTYQSQMAASTTTIASQCAEQQFVHLAFQQNMMHKNMHQIIAQVNALSFNQSNAERGHVAGTNFEGNGGRGRGRGQCLVEHKIMLPMEDILVPAAVLPRLQDSLPQTLPQEE
jgi:hypothetical protein